MSTTQTVGGGDDIFSDTHGRSRRLKTLGKSIDRLTAELGQAQKERDALLEAASASDTASAEHKRLKASAEATHRTWMKHATAFTERCRELGATKLAHVDPALSPMERHELRSLADKHERWHRNYLGRAEELQSFEVKLSQRRAEETLLDADEPGGPRLQEELDRLDERIQYLRGYGGVKAEAELKKLVPERTAIVERFNSIQQTELEKLRRRPERAKGNGKKAKG